MMDPYEVLMLDRRACTLRDLHNNYYRLSAQLHPSRCKLPRKEAREVMQLLERSFEKVEADLQKRRHSDAGSVSAHLDPESMRNVSSVSSERAREASKKFDMARFNQVYESLRAPSVYDKGYQEWMRQTSGDENCPKACDEYDETYEPQASTYTRGKGMDFCEIGVDDVQDFGNLNDRGPKNAIKFADIRDAHSARNNMINSRLEADFKLKPKTLDDVIAERANTSTLVLTPAQARAHQERAALLERMEHVREQQVARATKEAAAHFDAAHNTMFRDVLSTPSSSSSSRKR